MIVSRYRSNLRAPRVHLRLFISAHFLNRYFFTEEKKELSGISNMWTRQNRRRRWFRVRVRIL